MLTVNDSAVPTGQGPMNNLDYKTPRKRQETLNEFWDALISKAPGKMFQIFPRSLYANLLPTLSSDGASSRISASASYQAAVEKCKEQVEPIKRECYRTNEKFTDADFDIESDPGRNCLKGLSSSLSVPAVSNASSGGPALRNALSTLIAYGIFGEDSSVYMNMTALQGALVDDVSPDTDYSPAATHRIDHIFEKPSFVIDGFSSSAVRQGASGNCWWVAAVSTLCSNPDLIKKICVDHDADCGVYGFVFYRDGDWISTVVDDNLYMR